MKLVAGVDEVGRGPLAGPVIACALILPKHHSIEGLKDSKKLSKKRREALYPIIQEQAITIGIGESDVETIDKFNIREATFKAMKNALNKLDPKPEIALIDGECIKDFDIPNKGIIGGDNKVDAIMAASIIAKVTRDSIMNEYSGIFYEYGFEKNSGYGTKLHIEALEKYKATPIHRRSFRPVTNQMPSMDWIIKNDRTRWLGLKLAGLFLMKNGFEKIKIISDHPLSEQIDIVCKKNDSNVYINVHTFHKTKDEKYKKDISNIPLSSSSAFTKSNNLNSIEHDKFIFKQIFVGLQKGKPDISFKEIIL